MPVAPVRASGLPGVRRSAKAQIGRGLLLRSKGDRSRLSMC
jgi:hypothetical protein